MRQLLSRIVLGFCLLVNVASANTMFELNRFDVRVDWQMLRDAADVLQSQRARIEHMLPLPNHSQVKVIFNRAEIRGENNFVLYGDVIAPNTDNARQFQSEQAKHHTPNHQAPKRQSPSLAQIAIGEVTQPPSKDKAANDERVWRAPRSNSRTHGKKNGNIMLSVRNDAISGHLFTGRQNYSIRPVRRGVFRIVPARDVGVNNLPKKRKPSPSKVWGVKADERP